MWRYVLTLLLVLFVANIIYALDGLGTVRLIQFNGNVTEAEIDDFIDDYSEYQLVMIWKCTSHWVYPFLPCKRYEIMFNNSIISEEDFEVIIGNDYRVGRVFSYTYPRPRILKIELTDGTDALEFLESYSQYRLNGNIPETIPDMGIRYFSFDDTMFYPGDLLDVLNMDTRVQCAEITFELISGEMMARFINHEAAFFYHEDYEHYGFDEMIYQDYSNPNLHFTYFIRFNVDIIDDFSLLIIMNADERVLSASLNGLIRIDECPGPLSSTDSSISPQREVNVYPNPTRNEYTNFLFSVDNPKGKSKQYEVIIYNIKGQQVRTITDFHTIDGDNIIVWDHRDNLNKKVSSGVYLYKIISGEIIISGKLLILK